MGEYPHQMSGGMRQRIVGAIAISCAPRLLIADEPTTSLDLTIQAQYLNLLRDLQRQHELALIFITHNLGIVAKMCDQVAVMYAGRLVEWGPVTRIFDAPAHPYTQALLGSIPRMGDGRERLTAIEGQPPDLAAPPSGCAFHPRCPQAMAQCREQTPPETVLAPRHTTRCWLSVPAPATLGRGAMNGTATPILEARNLTKHFPVKRGVFAKTLGVVRAVDGVNFSDRSGPDPGPGRASRAAARPPPPSWCCGWRSPPAAPCASRGTRSAASGGNDMKQYRRAVQAVFQDPFASLNPRMRVDAIIAEPLVTHERLPRRRGRQAGAPG